MLILSGAKNETAQNQYAVTVSKIRISILRDLLGVLNIAQNAFKNNIICGMFFIPNGLIYDPIIANRTDPKHGGASDLFFLAVL